MSLLDVGCWMLRIFITHGSIDSVNAILQSIRARDSRVYVRIHTLIKMVMHYEPLLRGGRGPGAVVPPPPSGQQDFLEVVRIWKDSERLWQQNWFGV